MEKSRCPTSLARLGDPRPRGHRQGQLIRAVSFSQSVHRRPPTGQRRNRAIAMPSASSTSSSLSLQGSLGRPWRSPDELGPEPPCPGSPLLAEGDRAGRQATLEAGKEEDSCIRLISFFPYDARTMNDPLRWYASPVLRQSGISNNSRYTLWRRPTRTGVFGRP